MPRTDRRSKLQRVSRFDATARPQVDSTLRPRIDVEPAEPPRGHLVHRRSESESIPKRQMAAACDAEAEPVRSDGSTSDGGGSVVVGLSSGRSYSVDTPPTLGSRLLQTIAWSLLLWIPVCVWLAIQVRL